MRTFFLVCLIVFLPFGIAASDVCDDILANADIEKLSTPVEMQVALDLNEANRLSPDFHPHDSLKDMIMSWHFSSGFDGLSGQASLLAALYLSQWDGVKSIRLKPSTSPDPYAFRLYDEPNEISISLPVEPSGRIPPISIGPVLPGMPNYDGPPKKTETRVGIPKQPRQTLLIPFYGTKQDVLKIADLHKFDSASQALICNLLACGTSQNSTAKMILPQGKLVDLTLNELFDDNIFKESLSVEEYPELRIRNTDGNLTIFIGSSLYVNNRNNHIIRTLEYSETKQEFLISYVANEKKPEDRFRIIFDRKSKTAQLFELDNGEWELFATFH